MTDSEGYYTDPTLIHLNVAVMRDKVKSMEETLKLLIAAVERHTGEKIVRPLTKDEPSL